MMRAGSRQAGRQAGKQAVGGVLRWGSAAVLGVGRVW